MIQTTKTAPTNTHTGMKIVTRPCARAGCPNTFTGVHSRHYCSGTCARLVDNAKSRDVRATARAKRLAARPPCRRCGKPLTGKGWIYCGRTCDQAERRETALAKAAAERAARPPKPIPPRTCVECDKPFTPKSTSHHSDMCSDFCRWRHNRGRGSMVYGPPSPRYCKRCGGMFFPRRRLNTQLSAIAKPKSQTHCSDACTRRDLSADQVTKKLDAASINNFRRRIVKAGFGAEIDVTATTSAVIAKFSHRCTNCHRQTMPQGSRRGHHLASTVDHVTPIDAGGAHVWDNLTLLCGECNKAKSNRHICRTCNRPVTGPYCAPCLAAGHDTLDGGAHAVCRHCGVVDTVADILLVRNVSEDAAHTVALTLWPTDAWVLPFAA